MYAEALHLGGCGPNGCGRRSVKFARAPTALRRPIVRVAIGMTACLRAASSGVGGTAGSPHGPFGVSRLGLLPNFRVLAEVEWILRRLVHCLDGTAVLRQPYDLNCAHRTYGSDAMSSLAWLWRWIESPLAGIRSAGHGFGAPPKALWFGAVAVPVPWMFHVKREQCLHGLVAEPASTVSALRIGTASWTGAKDALPRTHCAKATNCKRKWQEGVAACTPANSL